MKLKTLNKIKKIANKVLFIGYDEENKEYLYSNECKKSFNECKEGELSFDYKLFIFRIWYSYHDDLLGTLIEHFECKGKPIIWKNHTKK